ncbi:MAG TPA: hypothetical protein VLE69_03935 [Candidatus Saccharimonadales bacterium]|nr:hypothetical protein [Candidatus Saccharimonadales bacterium]
MNSLTHLAEFEKILKHYHISQESRKILDQTDLVILTGLSSSGRNTIIRELEKGQEYYFIVSDTTRNPRSNNGVLEKDGREYWFRSEEEMLRDLQEGRLLEAEIIHSQQVSGTSIRELLHAKEMKKIALADMDIGGAQNVMNASKKAVIALVLPPNFSEWLRRMNQRGHMPKEEQRRRLETARTILKIALEDDRFTLVINHDHHDSALYIDLIAHQPNAIDSAHQADGKVVAQQLLADTANFLAK